MYTTSNFTTALSHVEFKSISNLDSKWCVTTKYGVFFACPLWYAEEKNYHIVCVTLY